jgi:hypothetical protein
VTDVQTSGYVYAIEFLRGDQALPAVGVTPDFAPAIEAARFAAFRAGAPPETAFVAEGQIEPRWHQTLGEPYIAGLAAFAHGCGSPTAVEVPSRYFQEAACAASAPLVQQGVINAGEPLSYLVTAFRGARDSSSRRRRAAPEAIDVTRRAEIEVEELSVSIDVREEALATRLGTASRHGQHHPEDVNVLIPGPLLEEARALVAVAEEMETGGLLVGHVCRDTDSRDVFLDVTDLLPARHTQATVSTLTFTSETWWDARAALALRGRGESFLGWLHTHPVSAMCRRKGCSPEAQRNCPMARDFFSGHDRFLHKTMFPRAYAIALVVNDWDFAPISVSLFGYRHGLIEPRGFHVVDAVPGE